MNRCESFTDIIQGNLDILLISKTKINDNFPQAQFSIDGFSDLSCLDRTAEGGGISLYGRQDIPSRRMNEIFMRKRLKVFIVEPDLRNKKWFLSCPCISHKDKITSHLKDTHREKARSNKTPALTESTNMDIWVVGTSNQIFIRSS